MNSIYRSEELINSLLLIAAGGVRHAERKLEPEIIAHGETILHSQGQIMRPVRER
jgi:hypothetical protein